jgi:hypothetical protein
MFARPYAVAVCDSPRCTLNFFLTLPPVFHLCSSSALPVVLPSLRFYAYVARCSRFYGCLVCRSDTCQVHVRVFRLRSDFHTTHTTFDSHCLHCVWFTRHYSSFLYTASLRCVPLHHCAFTHFCLSRSRRAHLAHCMRCLFLHVVPGLRSLAAVLCYFTVFSYSFADITAALTCYYGWVLLHALPYLRMHCCDACTLHITRGYNDIRFCSSVLQRRLHFV